MSVICTYTLLLAGAAAVIIRWARVWDDARMILLVLVLLFLALSVSFDNIVLANPLAGLPLLVCGLLFSVAVSEGLLRGLNMRLSAAYRMPYYLMLALLFGYPLALGWLSASGHDRALAWGVYMFNWLAAGAFLTLIPAARDGHRDRHPNGTPWRWPLYPWSLFVFLWLCFALRAYSLSFAFEAPRNLQAVFEPHFLLPLILAAAVLLLEIGIATHRRSVRYVAMCAPLGVIVLSLLNTGATDTLFAQSLRSTIGSPLQIACWLLVVYYGIAWLRSIRIGEAGLIATLLLLSVVSSETVDPTTLCHPQPWAIDGAAIVLASMAIVRKQKWKAILAGVFFVAASSLRDSGLMVAFVTLHHGYYLVHCGIVLVLLIAVLGNDRFSRAVRSIGFAVLPLAACFAALTYDTLYPDVPAPLHMLYIVALTMASWGFWDRRQQTHNLAGALGTSLACALTPAKRAYVLLQMTSLERALPFLVGGMLLLAVGVLISLYKGGILQRGWSALAQLNEQLRRQPAN